MVEKLCNQQDLKKKLISFVGRCMGIGECGVGKGLVKR
jgi:hypothetical protein